MDSKQDLIAALTQLGELLRYRGLAYDLVLVGGAAMLLQDLIQRPTLDLDAVARSEKGAWYSAKPLPAPLVAAVRDIAVALNLPREPLDDKDWLNAAPAFLLGLGLPAGYEERLIVQQYGTLTVRLASRRDLIALKLFASTAYDRASRRAIDIADMKEMQPTQHEIQDAVRWCQQRDGRVDFFERDLSPVLRKLGFVPESCR